MEVSLLYANQQFPRNQYTRDVRAQAYTDVSGVIYGKYLHILRIDLQKSVENGAF